MSNHLERAKVIVRGAVQGVGFRPFVYRLAKELGLNGWVSNTAQGVFIEVEGNGTSLREFLVRLQREQPAHAIIQSFEFSFLDAVGYRDFTIRESEDKGAKTAFILPDIASCPHCLTEIFDPRTTAVTAIRSPTAPIADRGSRSSRNCPTTARTPR